MAVRRLRMIVAPTADLPTEAGVTRPPTVEDVPCRLTVADTRCRPTAEAEVEPRTEAEALELLMAAEVVEDRPVGSVAVAVHLAVPVVEEETMVAVAEDRTADATRSLSEFHTMPPRLGGISFS